MERYNKIDLFPDINPDWNRQEVRELIKRHKKESFDSGVYYSFADAILHNVENLKGHISIRQIDMSERIAIMDAPIAVLTDYDEISDELLIRLAKIDVKSGWIISAAEKYRVDTSIANVGVIRTDGSALLGNYFTQEQFNILNNQKAEYSELGFNFSLARRRHIDNQIRW